MGKRKKIKRLLRQLSERGDEIDELVLALDDAVGRNTAAQGVCEPVGSFLPRWPGDRPLGIRFETPGAVDPAAARARRRRASERIAELEVALRHAEETRDALDRGKLKAERERDEALRHVEHHHAQGGTFTVIREVTPQVQRANDMFRESNEALRGLNRELAAKLSDAEAALEWHAEAWCPGITPPTAAELVQAWRDQSDAE